MLSEFSQDEADAYQKWKQDYALTSEPEYCPRVDVDCQFAFLAGIKYVIKEMEKFYVKSS